jgi:hypothetical protein
MCAKRDCELMLKARLKEGAPLFFFPENLFFTLSMINVRRPHLAGPPPLHPWGPCANSGGRPLKKSHGLRRNEIDKLP